MAEFRSKVIGESINQSGLQDTLFSKTLKKSSKKNLRRTISRVSSKFSFSSTTEPLLISIPATLFKDALLEQLQSSDTSQPPLLANVQSVSLNSTDSVLSLLKKISIQTAMPLHVVFKSCYDERAILYNILSREAEKLGFTVDTFFLDEQFMKEKQMIDLISAMSVRLVIDRNPKNASKLLREYIQSNLLKSPCNTSLEFVSYIKSYKDLIMETFKSDYAFELTAKGGNFSQEVELSETTLSVKEHILNVLKSYGTDPTLLLDVIYRVASKENRSLTDVFEDCYVERARLGEALLKDSGQLGFSFNSFSLEAQFTSLFLFLSRNGQAFRDAKQKENILLTDSLEDQLATSKRILYAENEVGSSKELLSVMSAFEPSDYQLSSLIKNEEFYWYMHEWLPTYFRSKLLEEGGDTKLAIKACIQVIQENTGESAEVVIDYLLLNFKRLSSQIDSALLVATAFSDENSVLLQETIKKFKEDGGFSGLKDYLNVISLVVSKDDDSNILSEEKMTVQDVSQSSDEVHSILVDDGLPETESLSLNAEIQDLIFKNLSFMNNLSKCLTKSNNSRAKDYGAILHSIFVACSRKFLSDADAQATAVSRDPLKVVTDNDLVYEFNKILNPAERRLLNTGADKLKRIAEGTESVKKSEIGEGGHKDVFYALNISTFVKELQNMRLGIHSVPSKKRGGDPTDDTQISQMEQLEQDLLMTGADLRYKGGVEEIVQNASRGEKVLSSSQIEMFTNRLKQSLRKSRVAASKSNKSFFHRKHQKGRPEVRPDVKLALRGSKYCILPLSQGAEFEISELAGKDLSEHSMTKQQICQATVATARALQEMHGRGVVHLDIKPSNLVLLKDGDYSSVRVIDFDVSRMTQSFEESFEKGYGVLLGTPSYMAPEFFDKYNLIKRPVKFKMTLQAEKLDLFSLGVTICSFFGLSLDIIDEQNVSNEPKSLYRYYRFLEKLRDNVSVLHSSNRINVEQKDVLLGLLSDNVEERPPLEKVIEVFQQPSAKKRFWK